MSLEAGQVIRTPSGAHLVLWGAGKPECVIYPVLAPKGFAMVEVRQ